MACELLRQVAAVPSRQLQSHVIKTSLTNADAWSGFIYEDHSFRILTNIISIQYTAPSCVKMWR